ncbi:MAG: response regulator [Flavobacteriia bacterium]|jgi:PAS domain S-box-containing protein
MERKLKIFLVEDETSANENLKDRLVGFGHDVIGVSDEHAYSDINGQDVDLVIINIQLSSNVCGIPLAKKLSSLIALPVVFITKETDDLAVSELRKLGDFDYISKPMSDQTLRTHLNYVMHRHENLKRLKLENDTSKKDLLDTEKFFEQVVSNVSDIIFRLDLNGFFTYLNPSAIEKTGYSFEELALLKYSHLIRKDYKRKTEYFFRQMLKNEKSESYLEIPIVLIDGTEVWIGQNIHLLTRNDKTVGFQVVARDITKEIEFKQQLIQAKKDAEHASELKEQFLANMSHEIRTPLNGIVGIVKLLERTKLNEKQQSYLRAISASSDQLMGIINDILDLSKIDSGKMDINAIEFNFKELIKSITSVMELKAVERGVKISYKFSDDVPDILIGDPVILNQILYNLIGNSLKFTFEGEVLLGVDMIANSTDDQFAEVDIYVKDTGVGMKPEVQEKIFDAFTQAESSTTRKFGGTGLGLTIVKKLIDIQNGTLYLNSVENEGTEFRVRLKFKKPSDEFISIEEQQDSSFELIANKKVLLVEDNYINQLVTKDLLEELKAVIVVADNGKIGLDKLDKEHFDIVLMDMQMPVLDGYQTMKIIRSEPLYADLPILALTANAIDKEIEKCMKSGASDYLSKPFLPEDLFRKIERLLVVDKTIDLKNEKVNVETLKTFTGFKPSLIDATLRELIKLIKEEEVDLKKIVAKEDEVNLKANIHKLKPSFQMVGLNGMAQMCVEIEQTEEGDGVFKKAEKIISRLPEIVDQMDLILEDMKK